MCNKRDKLIIQVLKKQRQNLHRQGAERLSTHEGVERQKQTSDNKLQQSNPKLK